MAAGRTQGRGGEPGGEHGDASAFAAFAPPQQKEGAICTRPLFRCLSSCPSLVAYLSLTGEFLPGRMKNAATSMITLKGIMVYRQASQYVAPPSMRPP